MGGHLAERLQLDVMHCVFFCQTPYVYVMSILQECESRGMGHLTVVVPALQLLVES